MKLITNTFQRNLAKQAITTFEENKQTDHYAYVKTETIDRR